MHLFVSIVERRGREEDSVICSGQCENSNKAVFAVEYLQVDVQSE